MAKQPKFYGLVAGKYAVTYSDAVNKGLDDEQIVKTWASIADLQREINTQGPTVLKGITAILIIDKSFKADASLESRSGVFHFLQSMFKDKEYYGTHLILYTQDNALFSALNSQYDNDPNSRYEGTRILLCDTDYTTESLARVFESPFELLSYDERTDREIERRNKHLEEQKMKIRANREFMALIGRKETLEDLIGTLNRELSAVNKNIYEYAMDLQSNNIDALTSDLDATIDKEISEQLKKLR